VLDVILILVILMGFILLNVILRNAIMLCIILKNVILLTDVFLSVSLPNFNVRNVILLSTYVLIVILPSFLISCQSFNCHSAYHYARNYSIQYYSAHSQLADCHYSDFLKVVVSFS
jgi:hypothetical protein